MGLIGAVGALGGVGINMAFRQSFLSYGSGTGAFVAFLAYYALCFAITWAVYLRRTAPATLTTAAAETKPQLSYAEV
jgi:NNP family nitrate/nitrite transporter-like MFS transporter